MSLLTSLSISIAQKYINARFAWPTTAWQPYKLHFKLIDHICKIMRGRGGGEGERSVRRVRALRPARPATSGKGFSGHFVALESSSSREEAEKSELYFVGKKDGGDRPIGARHDVEASVRAR